MNDRVVTLDTSTHRTVQELLPWFVIDRLSRDETALVQRHLRLCTRCQADAEWHRKLQAAEPDSHAVADVERAFARLRPRLQMPRRPPGKAALSRFLQGLRRGMAPWMGWALAGQTLALAGCIALLAVRSEEGAASYRTLGAGAAAASLVATFKPDTPERELRRILQRNGAEIVGGPTDSDAYLLKVPRAHLQQSVKDLHAEPAIMLIEPLDSGNRR